MSFQNSDFLLVRSTCTGAGCTVDGDGTNRKVYNTTASSTSKVTTIAFSNSYVSGGSSTSGFVVRDTVHLGRLSAVQQAINAATTVGGSFQQLYADGLMGLGYPALSSSGLPSLPITLQSQRIINPALFAFRLSSTPKVSELSMGSVNPNKFTGTFTQFPIAKDAGYNVFTYFQIANSLANVNGVAIGGTAGTYILDTGTVSHFIYLLLL